MRLFRRHLSYANVASTLALVFAMGGGAYAVASVRGDAAATGSAQVLIPAASAACAATGDTSAEVLTVDSSGTAAGRPFNVLFG